MHRFFVGPSQELTLYEDVLLDAMTALIVRPDGTPIIEQADEVLYWRPKAFHGVVLAGADPDAEYQRRLDRVANLGREIASRQVTAIPLPADVSHIYMAHPFGLHAYGHLFDSLQRLRYGMTAPGSRVVLHGWPSRVVEFEEHLRRLGVTQAIAMRREWLFRVPKLWVSPWQASPAQISSDCLDWIFQRYTADVRKTSPLRLYLSRNHVQAGKRGVLNEEAVLGHLAPLGFTVMTGREPLSEILEKFYNAEIILGPHGSMFANTIFARERCAIIEFCPGNRLDVSFRDKRKKARFYRHIAVPGDDDWNITIPIDQLAAEIDAALDLI